MDKGANCRALTVLCAAAGRSELLELKRAAVAAEWELVGGAASLSELEAQLEGWGPNVVVIDGSLGEEAVTRARQLSPRTRVVTVGSVVGADAVAESLAEVHAAILGLPRGGAVPSL